MSAKLFKLGMESIDFQSGLFHTELTAVINRLRKDATYTTEAIEASGFSEIVKRHTGLSVYMMIKSLGVGAAVEIPQVDKNHPLITNGSLSDYRWRDAKSTIEFLGRQLKGSVDRKSSKVSGDFTKFPVRLWLGLELLKRPDITDAEVSGFLLHEVGHIFAYFEYLGYTYRTNMVLAAISRGFNETPDIKERKMVLRTAEKVLGIEYEDIEKVADTTTIDSVEVITLTETAKRMRSELGENLYNVRAFEQLADEFAARHGAARDTATGMAKIYRLYGDKATDTTTSYLAMEAIKLTLFMSITYFSAGIATLIALASWPGVSSYDDPKDRVEKFKNQLVMRLKDRSLTDGQRAAFVEDIKVLDDTLDTLAKRRTFYEFLVETVVPSRRKMRQQNEIQVELERLASNDLYVAAAKFQVGATSNA